MVFHRFSGILRARRNKTAGAGQHGRDDSLVKTQSELKKFLHLSNCQLSFCVPVLASTFTNARCTSSASCVKAASKAVFLGLITTSTGAVRRNRCWRTASRTLRRMRLRTAAGPRARPTVKPTLAGPSGPAEACARRRKNTVMLPEKCLRPVLYTFSKSACLRRRAVLGNPWIGACFALTWLLAKTGLHRDSLAAFGAAARKHGLSALGLHPAAKTVFFRPPAAARLECAL